MINELIESRDAISVVAQETFACLIHADFALLLLSLLNQHILVILFATK